MIGYRVQSTWLVTRFDSGAGVIEVQDKIEFRIRVKKRVFWTDRYFYFWSGSLQGAIAGHFERDFPRYLWRDVGYQLWIAGTSVSQATFNVYQFYMAA
jgi:hypothetical protein